MEKLQNWNGKRNYSEFRRGHWLQVNQEDILSTNDDGKCIRDYIWGLGVCELRVQDHVAQIEGQGTCSKFKII